MFTTVQDNAVERYTLRDARAGDVLDIAPILERLGIAPEPINYKEPYVIEELEIAGDTAVLFSTAGGNWSLPRILRWTSRA